MAALTGSPRYGFKRYLAVVSAAIIGLDPIAGQAAGLLSGQFSGTAINSAVFRPPFGDFDGRSIVGTFLIDLSQCTADAASAPYPGSCLASAKSGLTAVIPGQSDSFGQPATLVEVLNTPSAQRLSIIFGFTNPYSSARLELVGGTNAFIDGADFSTLHAGAIDLAESMLTLSGGRSYTTGVALNSFTFEQDGTSVPDAPTWSLLLVGFAMTGLATRVRQQNWLAHG